MKKNSGLSNSALFLTIAVILVLVGGVAYYAGVQKPEPEENIPEEDNNVVPGPAIEGNKDDLVSFSVAPGSTVSGVLNFSGVVKNAYFFEANIGVNILDANKKLLKAGYGTASTDWMTSGPVTFSGTIDLTGLPTGPGYIEIHNDNASGLPENDKSILIPVLIGQ